MASVKEETEGVIPSGGNNSSGETSDTELEAINEKSLLRKLDAQLLPAVGILYLLSFLDRSNGMIPQSELC